MGPVCEEGKVSTPCASTAWDFGATALYLTQRDGTPTYLGYSLGDDGKKVWQDFRPDSGFGFRLEGSYHYGTGYDLNVNWLYYSKKSNQDLLLANQLGQNIVSPVNVDATWNFINFEFGNKVNFGEMRDIRFFGGAQFASVDNKINVSGVTNPARLSGVVKYNGFGPRVGAQLNNDFKNGLSLYAMGAMSILAGPAKADLPILLNGNVIGGNRADKVHYVPTLEGKLGGNYTFHMAQGDLSIDAGYMWLDLRGTYLVPSPSGADIQECNTSFGAPYLGFKWVGVI